VPSTSEYGDPALLLQGYGNQLLGAIEAGVDTRKARAAVQLDALRRPRIRSTMIGLIHSGSPFLLRRFSTDPHIGLAIDNFPVVACHD
jgi:hypothetical protein